MTASTPLSGPALRVERLTLLEWQARIRGATTSQSAIAASGALGALSWGEAMPGAAALLAPVLDAAGPRVDAWFGQGPAHDGRSGAVHWRADAQWAFGHVDLPDADTNLADTAYRAYSDLFAALRDCERPHLLRLWNYLPRINADGGGLERYRQFNIGRQQAFLDSGRDAFEGAPAACALGTHGGAGLQLRFLSGLTPPLPLENPRQVPAYRYSATYGPRAPTFSRGALADVGGGHVALFVSGTASIVGEHSMHPGDVRAQVDETLTNLRALLGVAAERCSARFALEDLECSVYVRHASDAAAIRKRLDATGACAQAVFMEADICRSELLLEIEAHAIAPGALR